MARRVSSPPTHTVFRDDPYATSCEATVLAVNEMGGIIMDRSVFYPTGGGQPGDSGVLTTSTGDTTTIAITVKGRDEDGGPDVLVHVPAEGQLPIAPGTLVTAKIDWDRRHKLMRVHTCLHLLSAVVPFPVTGGQVGEGKGRAKLGEDGFDAAVAAATPEVGHPRIFSARVEARTDGTGVLYRMWGPSACIRRPSLRALPPGQNASIQDT